MNKILASHVIDADALRSDNFEAFFYSRQNALLDRIEKAIGKTISRDTLSSTEQVEEDDDDVSIG